jgi:hypothetical protein
MKTLMSIAAISLILALALVVGACSKKSSAPTDSGTSATQLLLSPTDGQTNVRLDAPVVLTFTKSVDRATVERGFHLISEKAMADSLCPVSPSMGHGNMMNSMTDSSKMHHLDQYHAMRGQYLWNTDSTLCTFKPDSMMTPQTQYMMHVDREMTQMMEDRMGGMGMMTGHGTEMMSTEMMFHFSTQDATGSGSGHMGHH